MPITHVNDKGKTYYLHQGVTKTGKPKYHFAMKSEGTLADSIPEGFEIYENPNAQVFLRRIPPKIITDAERRIVDNGMRNSSGVFHYKIDVKGNEILIYSSVEDIVALNTMLQTFPSAMEKRAQIIEAINQSANYSPVMKFELIDVNKRLL